MVVQEKLLTVQEFDEFVMRPENADRLFEYIGGKIVEVVSNPYSSKIASRINGYIFVYLSKHDIGHLTGADGGYMVSGERYIPDVAFISYARQPELSTVEGYVPNAPDLAVEVLSRGNTDEELTIKVANYLAAGTVVWMVKPVEKRVVVFAPGSPARTLGINDTLDGGAVLPGFTLAVKAIFPE